jgi:hypothetical protein
VESIAVLIFFAVLGAYICAKARVAAGSVVFALIALVLFIGTPLGSGLPQVVSDFLSAFDRAASPVLVDQPGDGVPAQDDPSGTTEAVG